MVLPFQDDNLSIEYSQFRQDGLLKKKNGTKWLCDSFLFKYQFFFPKNDTYSCYMVGNICVLKIRKKNFWVLLSNSLASKGGGTRKRKENFLSFCVCDVNVTVITLTQAKNGTRWPPITYYLLELLVGMLHDARCILINFIRNYLCLIDFMNTIEGKFF